VSRILFVIDGLWVGGSERSLAEMLPWLGRAGVSCTVAVLRHCADGVEAEVKTGGADVRLLPGPGLAIQVRALRGLIRTLQPQIVHGSLWKANLVSRLAVVGTGARQVTSLVNAPYGPERLAGDGALKPGRLRLAQAVEAVSGRFLTDHFHAVSEYARASALRDLRIPADRVTVVRRGRDVVRLGEPSEARRAGSRARLGIDLAAQVLVNVGRQDHQKAQVMLIDAFASLARSNDRLVLLLVGRRGQASDEIDRRIAEAGLGPRVWLLGHRDDVPDILAAADLFVFPSLWEGFPGAILEAMALGLPVVASAIPPHREILAGEECGLLVPPGDREALSIALAGLLAEPARLSSMGRRARVLFLERHTLERSLGGMLDLYSGLLAR
jgi:glycosyltransferase involved in cell wall biosynthesis